MPSKLDWIKRPLFSIGQVVGYLALLAVLSSGLYNVTSGVLRALGAKKADFEELLLLFAGFGGIGLWIWLMVGIAAWDRERKASRK